MANTLKLFTLDDLRNAFVAGETFEQDVINCDLEGDKEITELDFGDWVKKSYNINVE